MTEAKRRPLWTSIHPVEDQYPWLAKDTSCDVAVIGGGIAGAFAAYEFSKAGVSTLLATEAPIGFGETAESMGVLEYDHEEGLIALSKKIGKEKAVEAFSLCREGINRLEQICKELGDVGFARRDSLLCTEDRQELDWFYDEYRIRRHNGFPVELLSRESAGDLFSFPLEAGILSRGLGAEVDPYRLASRLVKKAAEHGCQVYENTAVRSISREKGALRLVTAYGPTITARRVILATGAEQDSYLNALSGKRTAFCVATKPVESFAGYESRCLIRDNKAPYTRVRSTPDNRLLIGGLDSAFIGKDGKIGGLLKAKKMVDVRYQELAHALEEMFCAIPGLEPEYVFSGSQPATRDRLPVFGEHPHYPGFYFDLCPGAGGILYACLGAGLLLRSYLGQQGGGLSPEDCRALALFAPDRDSL